MIARTTNFETCCDFVQHLRDELPVDPCEALLILDNHAVHRSARFQAFAAELGVEIQLLPRFSCELNPIERTWNQLKKLFAKRLACTHQTLPIDLLDQCVAETLDEMAATVTHRIMHAADRAIANVQAGRLV